jgi:hypothetical protein
MGRMSNSSGRAIGQEDATLAFRASGASAFLSYTTWAGHQPQVYEPPPN